MTRPDARLTDAEIRLMVADALRHGCGPGYQKIARECLRLRKALRRIARQRRTVLPAYPTEEGRYRQWIGEMGDVAEKALGHEAGKVKQP